jgi:DNA primase
MSACTEAVRLKATVSTPFIIAETIQLKRDGKTWTAHCPFHAERTPSFHVFRDHYHCFGCGAHGDVFDWLEKQRGLSFRNAIEYLGGNRDSPGHPPHSAPVRPVERAPDETMLRRREMAWTLWTAAVDPHGTAVERYLAARGVRLPDADVLRFHPRCPRDGGTLPAMVALMTEPKTDEFRGVHQSGRTRGAAWSS